MIYYSGFDNQTRRTAGAKAPSDIQELCRKRGYSFIPIYKPSSDLPRVIRLGMKYSVSVLYWKKVLRTLQADDVLIYQHPLFPSRLLPKYIDKLKKKGIKLVVLIHDLETLRKGIEGAVSANKEVNTLIEETLLKKFDAVICHNEKMKQYLLTKGYAEKQLVTLDIFDYLSNCKLNHSSEKTEHPSVMVAGNLIKAKSGYIYKINSENNNPDLTVHLFGIGFDNSENNPNLNYHGSFPAAELPEVLTGDFGLVWDGLSADTCEGNTGQYLKYNNPHKTSLYLSSGIPVIVWKEAAIADFVQRNHVGLAVDSLSELTDIICSLSQEEYTELCKNAEQISGKLRGGYYFYHALDEAVKRITS